MSDGLNPQKKTVSCDESNDYALQYFEKIPQWRNQIKVLPRELPWIRPEREPSQSWSKLSSAAKYLNYEMSPRFIDLEDPFVVQKFNDIRKVERFDTTKKKKKRDEERLDAFQSVGPKEEGSNDDNEEDDFLDEYGNIIESQEKSPSKARSKKTPIRPRPQAISLPLNKVVAVQTQKSFLNAEEQKNYLPLYIRFWGKGGLPESSSNNLQDRRAFSLFSNYVEAVRNEQIEFANHAKHLWYEGDHRKNYVLSEDVRSFVNSYFEAKIEDALRRLPPRLQDSKKFIRCSPANPSAEFDLSLESHLLELGVIPKVLIPTQESLAHNVKITTSSDKLQEQLTIRKKPQVSLSEDPNIDILAAHTQATIVISSNPMKTLFNNFGPCYERRWSIPLIVKRIDSRLVYFFEKALPEPPPFSAVKKKTVFIKILGKKFLLHPWTQSHYQHHHHVNEPHSPEEDPFEDASELKESFGVENISQLDGNEEEPSSSLDLGSILASQKDAHKVNEERQRPPNMRITSQYQGAPIDRTTENGGDVSEFMRPSRGNLVYKLWRLSKKPHGGPSSSHGSTGGDLKVLIRCSIHGIRPVGRKKNHKFPEVMTISTKLENQWTHGAEVATKSERARDWISTYIRPGSINCRLRVRHGYEVCTCDFKSLPALSHELTEAGIIPARQLGNLFEVFQGVLSSIHEEGTYLLIHDENSGPFLRLYSSLNEKEESSSNYLDLAVKLNPKEYQLEKTISVKAVPWIPLDFNIVTPWHKRNNRVPGLFEPCPVREVSGGGNNRKRKRGAKKKPQHPKEQS